MSGDGVLTTKSVNSCVFGDSDVTFADVHNGDSFTVQPEGHVMLLDYDDCDERMAIIRADELPGITAILKSSRRSYHVWNLSVADLKTTGCRMVLRRDDYNHVRAGIKRGYWRLRIGPKVRKGTDEPYKDPPELVAGLANSTDKPQSRPHFRLLKALFDFPDVPSAEWNWVGQSLTEQEYETLTDEAKEAWPDG